MHYAFLDFTVINYFLQCQVNNKGVREEMSKLSAKGAKTRIEPPNSGTKCQYSTK